MKRVDSTFKMLLGTFADICDFTSTGSEWNGNWVIFLIAGHCFPVTIVNRIFLLYDSVPHKVSNYTNPKKGALYLLLGPGHVYRLLRNLCHIKDSDQCVAYYLEPTKNYTLAKIDGSHFALFLYSLHTCVLYNQLFVSLSVM